jgi:uncharacterized protein YcbX
MNTWKDAHTFLNLIRTHFLTTTATTTAANTTTTTTYASTPQDQPFRNGSSDGSFETPLSYQPFRNGSSDGSFETHRTSSASSASSSSSAVKLTSIVVYPIKSCAGFEVTRWPLGPNGLFLDREWTVVDSDGNALRLKAQPLLAQVQPELDLARSILRVSAPGMEPLEMSFGGGGGSGGGGGGSGGGGGGGGGGSGGAAAAAANDVGKYCRLQLCGLAASGTVSRDTAVSEWFSRYLSSDVELVRCLPSTHKERRTAHIRGASSSSSSSSLSSSSSPFAITGSVPRVAQEALQPNKDDDTHHQQHQHHRSTTTATTPPVPEDGIGFANEGQYLLISEASYHDFQGRVVQAAAADAARNAITVTTASSSSSSSSSSVGRRAGFGKYSAVFLSSLSLSPAFLH